MELKVLQVLTEPTARKAQRVLLDHKEQLDLRELLARQALRERLEPKVHQVLTELMARKVQQVLLGHRERLDRKELLELLVAKASKALLDYRVFKAHSAYKGFRELPLPYLFSNGARRPRVEKPHYPAQTISPLHFLM